MYHTYTPADGYGVIARKCTQLRTLGRKNLSGRFIVDSLPVSSTAGVGVVRAATYSNLSKVFDDGGKCFTAQRKTSCQGDGCLLVLVLVLVVVVVQTRHMGTKRRKLMGLLVPNVAFPLLPLLLLVQPPAHSRKWHD